MTRYQNPLFVFSSAGMELCWVCAWAIFSCLLICGHAFPIPIALVVFTLSASLTVRYGKLTRIRWRLFGLHGASCVMVAVMMILTATYLPLDFLYDAWIVALSTRPINSAQWFEMVVVFVWVLIFWVSGAAWSNRSTAHQSICNRFDLGASLFFVLFLLKLFFAKRFGITIEASAAVYLLGSFFIFGLFSIGFAKNQNSNSGEFLDGYRGVGILLAFIVVIFLLGLSSISFFLHYSKMAAQFGYSALKTVTSPLFAWLVELIILIFKPSPDMVDRLRDQVDQGPVATGHVDSVQSENTVFMHGAGVFYGVLAIFFITGAIWLLYRWLTSQTEVKPAETHRSFATWAVQMLRRLRRMIAERLHQIRRPKEAAYFYSVLIKWGKHSGVVHNANETPSEYGIRLIQRFPKIKREVDTIVDHFNQCIYGGVRSGQTMLAMLDISRKKLRSPRLWPARLKSWVKPS